MSSPQQSDKLWLLALGCGIGAMASALTFAALSRSLRSPPPHLPNPPAAHIQIHETFWAPRRAKDTQRAAQPRRKVTVRVPATSANLGPGFDAIGMAVDMWSEITVERADRFEFTFVGDGHEEIPCDETNLVCLGVQHAFAAAVGGST